MANAAFLHRETSGLLDLAPIELQFKPISKCPPQRGTHVKFSKPTLHQTLQTLTSGAFVATIAAMLLASPQAFAHDEHGSEHGEGGGHHFVPKAHPPVTAPAAHFSGATPIDRTNGNFFNIGTYGNENPENQQWAKSSTWAVSLAERPYSYEQKKRFIHTLDERISHFEIAVWNYGKVTEVSRPEGQAHAQKAVADLKPRIEKAREAWSKAKSAGRADWAQAQDEAKRAFLELQSFYYGMHATVH